ncbi:hexamerin-like [Homalodisca vitripennis]|uniref:hexamerin-like n=1 Tax=Homalodisca vitripennis TaxID=197043 RepID=UPI001EECC507|nr:hexamerin-like [Homalodisca vitripennis]
MVNTHFTMKAVALLLCGLAFAAAKPYKQADKEFLQRQQDLLRLLVNIQPNTYSQEEQQQATSFNFEQQQQNSNNPDAVKQFQYAYEQGYLPRGEVFNYYNPTHLQLAIKLFDLFYFAKDYATFYQAACWARAHVNEKMSVYSTIVAIMNRPDTKGMEIPPLAEVLPFLYVNTRAVQQAQNLKQQGQKQAYVQSNNTYYYNYNPEQQHPEEYPYTNQYQHYETEQYANQYQQQYREGQVSYYNEDVYLNQQFAYELIKNPAWFNSQKYHQEKQQYQNNGENFYYFLQQLLARYNLERYSNNMPSVQPFQFNQYIKYGYNPQLQFANGEAVPARPHNYHINNANSYLLEELEILDGRIADAVDSHQAQAVDGTHIKFTPEDGVAVLGNLVQNNGDSVNNQYYAAYNGTYGYLDQCRKVISSTVNSKFDYHNAPAAIEVDEAANRDPAFYQCVSRIVNYFQQYKNQQKPYNQEQLNFPGVKVQSVSVDKLVTYFDDSEIDLYNVINYGQGEQPQNYQYVARQPQLNHKRFNIEAKVDSDKEAEAIVRVFIGPKYNLQGQQISLEYARQYFVEIDRFITKLKSGQNNLVINSMQSKWFVPQQPTTRQMFKRVEEALQEGKPYYYDETQSKKPVVFPQNLVLPKGSRAGQEYVLAVSVHPYQGSQPEQQEENRPYDNRPQGFPFDRVVRDVNFQQAQNIHFQTVKVFNKDQNEINKVEQ